MVVKPDASGVLLVTSASGVYDVTYSSCQCSFHGWVIDNRHCLSHDANRSCMRHSDSVRPSVIFLETTITQNKFSFYKDPSCSLPTSNFTPVFMIRGICSKSAVEGYFRAKLTALLNCSTSETQMPMVGSLE